MVHEVQKFGCCYKKSLAAFYKSLAAIIHQKNLIVLQETCFKMRNCLVYLTLYFFQKHYFFCESLDTHRKHNYFSLKEKCILLALYGQKSKIISCEIYISYKDKKFYIFKLNLNNFNFGVISISSFIVAICLMLVIKKAQNKCSHNKRHLLYIYYPYQKVCKI